MRRPDLPVLTSLRFPAAAAIVLLHCLPFLGWPLAWCEGLVSGVSFFYVLSGFILYYNYLDLTDRASFWVARFARIWPLHVVTFVLIWLLLPFNALLGHDHWFITIPANLLLVQAWLPFQGSILSYNGVAWSLSVELFFYLSFPWLLIGLKRYGSLPVLSGAFILGLTIVMAAQAWHPKGPDFGSFFPPCRLFEFILGMATCRLWLGQSRVPGFRAGWSWLEIGALLGVISLVLMLRPGLGVLGSSSFVMGWLATVMTAGGFAGLIWIFTHEAGVCSHFFSKRFFVRLGEISFALYMCHQILFRWFQTVPFGFGPSASWSFFLIYLGLSLGVSYALFAIVENPARRMILNIYKSWKKPAGTG